jgi:hypothetical protein
VVANNYIFRLAMCVVVYCVLTVYADKCDAFKCNSEWCELALNYIECDEFIASGNVKTDDLLDVVLKKNNIEININRANQPQAEEIHEMLISNDVKCNKVALVYVLLSRSINDLVVENILSYFSANKDSSVLEYSISCLNIVNTDLLHKYKKDIFDIAYKVGFDSSLLLKMMPVFEKYDISEKFPLYVDMLSSNTRYIVLSCYLSVKKLGSKYVDIAKYELSKQGKVDTLVFIDLIDSKGINAIRE